MQGYAFMINVLGGDVSMKRQPIAHTRMLLSKIMRILKSVMLGYMLMHLFLIWVHPQMA